MSIILRDGTDAGNVAAIDSDGSLHVTGSISATNPSVSPTGAAVPADATLVGGTEGGNLVPLALDGSGNLLVNVAAGSSGNSAASPTGSAVPADADYIGINVAGNLVGVSASNPLPITGSISATNPSVSATGSAVPADATMIGGTDGTDLRAILTDSTGQAKVLVQNFPSTQPVSGTVVAEIEGHSGATLDAAPGSAAPTNGVLVGGSDGTNFRAILTDTTGQAKVLVENFPSTQPVSGTVTADIVGHSGAILDAVLGAAIPPNAVLVGGSDGTNLRAILTDNTGQAKVLLENAIPAGTNVIGHVITDTGSTTAVTGNVTVTQATGTNLHMVVDSGTITTITNAVTVAQATAANLNATVVGTGTFTVQAQQSGNWTTRTVGNTGAVLDAAPGAAAPANAVQVGGTDGTNLRAFSTDTSGNLNVNVKSTPTGTTTGSAVPATATYEGINVAGTLRGATGVNPSGTVYAQQTDTTSVAGTTVSTAAAGVQKVGIVGNAGGAVDAATAATAPANAVQVGAVAATSYPTAVTNGQLVGAMSDKAGRLVVVQAGPRDIITPISYQSTSATLATIISAQGAGIFTDILWALFTNESSTATIVSLSDGTITYKIAIASNGGAMLPIPVPIKASSANAAWQISNSAAVNVDVILQYVSNK